MLISLLLFFIGLVIGYYLRVTSLLFCSAIVAITYATTCIILEKTSFINVVIAFALLTSLQGGYLLGAYMMHKTDS